jgi:MFS family permease
MTRDRLHFLLLNIGHFLDHLFMLVFATVAALALYRDWGIGYAELLAYATPGFFAFGVFALPAGWIADRWSRDGMMVVFFIGIGVASIVTSYANSPLQIGLGLFFIGVFAAIYHPVGLALVTTKWRDIGMRIAVNGVWGNLGVACAALLSGYLIDYSSWRAAFVLPGIVSVLIGFIYLGLRWESIKIARSVPRVQPDTSEQIQSPSHRKLLIRVSGIVFLTTAVSSIIFQSTTFALPKIFDERLPELVERLANAIESDGATIVGSLAFVVFAIASLAQLVVGKALDIYGPRRVFMAVATIEVVFFATMPGLTDGYALAVALGFMLGAFGQIPINDFMIGKMASGASRAKIYGVRYVVSFTSLAASLPLIAFIYDSWGFDFLFIILAGAAFVILVAAFSLPKQLPTTQTQQVPSE